MQKSNWSEYPYLALLTDFYQITMAYGYFKAGLADKEACFQLYFRRAPFQGSYAIACGLENVVNYLNYFHFNEADLKYLATLQDFKHQALFDAEFLDYLANLRFSCDVDAVPEGTAMFGHEPMLRVTGPILQCQLLETALLNMINFQTLIATKATRVCHAAQNDDVIDFGLRRAQGFDGGISASRAAFIGGCQSTSNVFAGREYNIPVKGTLAHSWIMSFESEQEAFATYSQVMPTNCVLLVDTYHSINGIKNAIDVGNKLKQQNHHLLAIRLDSGDLDNLSKTARHMLDEAGFQETKILVSGDLDEYRIDSLKAAGAPIDMWGVGTRLVTGFDDPALGGIYKLAAVKENNTWRSCIKVSDDEAKSTIPGVLQVRRYQKAGRFTGDLLFSPLDKDTTGSTPNPEGSDFADLLIPIFKRGKCIYDLPTLPQIRSRVTEQLSCLDDSLKQLKNPSQYSIQLDPVLISRRQQLTANVD